MLDNLDFRRGTTAMVVVLLWTGVRFLLTAAFGVEHALPTGAGAVLGILVVWILLELDRRPPCGH